MNITVLGTGYLGATHAACMAEIGHNVLGFDIDPDKVALLTSGRVPFYEPGLEEVLQRNIAAGRLRFTSDIAEVAKFGEVHFLCVGTPQKKNSNAADMSQIYGAADALAAHLNHPALIVGKSTVPVGTAAELQTRLQVNAPAGVLVDLAWNPEFLREGFAVEDTISPDRLVFGVDSPRSEATLRRLYQPILDKGTPLVVADFATAELVKTAANSFLATKISFINAMAEVCEAAGGDISVLSQAIGYDARIGNRFLRAGIGFGGGCLPKDIRAFAARAGELGVADALSFLNEVDAINLRRRKSTVELVETLLGGKVTNKTITILGAAFKPDSDDVRDSPALDIAATLQSYGAEVRVHDPKAIENARKRYPNLTYVDDVVEACQDTDIVVHLTEWSEYRDLAPALLGAKGKIVVDGRLGLDAAKWRAAGWQYRALGRPNA
jgi:UDPglucose 6-dehydrogenase